ncbi:FG-GAP repeat domain-containing protein [Fusarium denticulatum]|uniref:FG-GAP repeat domain-containing protein n=1 Tax=Fusarium denticulatum TaxID=48507 RepID=A0A8H5TAZ4_9HYPO|nr:FG-GAP repeat domain-containing protein [Fusarium denticulatum]
MAIKWAIALTAADHLGWIRAPVAGEGGGPNRDTCKHDPTWLPQGQIATGAGLAFLNLGSSSGGASTGKVQWSAQGTIVSGVAGNRASVRFADLNGGPDNGPNAAKLTLIPQGKIASGAGKDGAGVRFADLNGDGRAEYLYINTDGSVECWLNAGGTIALGVGVGRDSVVFADINGDGKADYIALSETDGDAPLWLDGGGPDDGPNAAKVVWLPHGKIADGGGSSGRDMKFVDLNGDSRAEYLDVKFDTSGVNAWLNGCQDA